MNAVSRLGTATKKVSAACSALYPEEIPCAVRIGSGVDGDLVDEGDDVAALEVAALQRLDVAAATLAGGVVVGVRLTGEVVDVVIAAIERLGDNVGRLRYGLR